MNAENSVKFIYNSRRTFLKYFPWRIFAVCLSTNAAIAAISAGTAALLAGCASTNGAMHDSPDYPHPWQRNYMTKAVSYDKNFKRKGGKNKRNLCGLEPHYSGRGPTSKGCAKQDNMASCF